MGQRDQKPPLGLVAAPASLNGSPPPLLDEDADAEDPAVLVDWDVLTLSAEASETWNRLVSAPPRDLPAVRALLNMPAPRL